MTSGLDGTDLPPLLELVARDPADLRDHPDPAVASLVQLTTAVAAHAVGGADRSSPGVLLGHSFGEIAALVAGGAFLPADGVRIVRMRMRIAARMLDHGGMSVLSTDARRAERLVRVIGSPSLAVACHNAPRSTVISGTASDLEVAARVADKLGVHVVRLPVRYAYHSPMMAPLVDMLRAELAESGVRQRALRTPVHCVCDNRPHTDQDDLLGHIAEMFVRPVRFLDSIRSLYDAGVDRFVDYGDGAIARMVEATVPAVEISCSPGVTGARSDHRKPAPPQPSVTRSVETADVATPPATEQIPPPPPVPASTEDVQRPSPVPAAPFARRELVAELATMYASVVGYPAEVFTEDVDLEGDLGIDSLRQVAFLTKVAERFSLPRNEIRISEYPTLGAIVDSVTAQLTAGAR
ncbi:acyltransferase domain-containing protein [Nocardia sp. NBC_00508]|uniref:acyltransferase domain-containing protein n=1 Tax=Nocardia sp. NBC_00508 TaxID=2975992 RepID=UPI002E81C5D2|nr:acyltransferase domain-containing protein [Nocardia sp. NBC_00508]WUD65849.1 acyltransferase domain-containing protein [Nocardia sp. NBC_00508]